MESQDDWKPAGSSPLLIALRESDPHTPESLVTFDRLMVPDIAPDFLEWSAHVAHDVCPHRLTYYFDTHRRGAPLARIVGERFLDLARMLGTTIPPPIARVMTTDVPAHDSVLQVVVGIDERTPPDKRIKYYLVFRSNPSEIIHKIVDSFGSPSPVESVDVQRTYIVGIDFREDGVDDVKLYFRLDLRHLGRVVENVADFDPLVRLSRDVVFQHCLLHPERRQMYLHATHDRVIGPWLAATSRARPAFSQLVQRQIRTQQALTPTRVAPWIISFPYRNRRMDASTSNVYFHLAHA